MEKLQEEHEGNQMRDPEADKKLRTCKIVNVVLVVVIVVLVLVICIAIPLAAKKSGGLLQTACSYFRACMHTCLDI